MKPHKVIGLSMLCFAGLLIWKCSPTSPDHAGNISQTGNGMVVGSIVDANGNPVKGATVYLRKRNTLADTTGALLKRLASTTDTVTTNDSGKFVIDSIDTGTYVIEGISGDNLALNDSVAVTDPDSTVTLPPDTLKPAGAIKGVIRLSEGGDPRKVFVLAFGIDRFARVEANGAFKFNGLAEATYDLRIISSLDDYGVLDTVNVPVFSADTTNLGTIDLPFTGIPTPKNVMTSYDTLKQIVTLTWDKADTALVGGYNVYRRNVDSNTVAARINTSPITDTMYRDSTGIQDQTYEYKVTAVDKQGNEGKLGSGVSVKVVGAFEIDTVFGSGQFSVPNDLAISPNGHLFIVDDNTSRVQVYDTNFTFVRQFGDTILQRPMSIAFDRNGNTFVADYQLQKIFVFSPTDSLKVSFTVTGLKKIAIDSKNRIFVSTTRDSIYSFDSLGNTINGWGGNGAGEYQFNQPSFLAIDKQDNVYVCDNLNNRIQIFDSLGILVTIINVGEQPNGVAVQPVSGNIMVVSEHGNFLNAYDPSGELLSHFEFPKFGLYNDPRDIELLEQNIYVSLSGVSKIAKLINNLD